MSGIFRQITFTVGQEDDALYQIATDLESQGWIKTIIPPVCEISCDTNLTPFGGLVGAYIIDPPVGVSHPRVLVVDALHGYTPDPSWIVIETGSTDKQVIVDTVASVFEMMGTVHGSLSTLLATNPNTPAPNHLIASIQGSSQLYQLDGLPIVGVALNVDTVVPLLNGGYAMERNGLYIFLGRRYGVDPVNHPGPIVFAISSESSPFQAPMLLNAVGRDNITNQIDRDYASYHYYANEDFFIMYDDATGAFHVTAVNLELIEGSNITKAQFGVIGNNASLSRSFRTSLRCGGEYMLRINDDIGYDGLHDSVNIPRIAALVSGNAGGHKWENGLAQITEPWVAFHTESNHRSGIVGRMPRAIVANTSLNADAVDPFTWDGRTFKVLTKNIPATNIALGSLCLETDENDPIAPCSGDA